MADTSHAMPDNGRPAAALIEEIEAMSGDDLDWRGGHAFSLVYNADDPELERLQHRVADMFLHENALNPFAYPSLVRMEQEVVGFAADLFGTDPGAGTMASGGTESIFLAVHTAREVASERGRDARRIVMAETAHPAFTKAAHYLEMETVRIPVGADLRADVAAMSAQIDERTALVVGSAPCYPYGVIDPITDLAALALDVDALCHVDACLGGWLLPFWERIGEAVPDWNFSVPGVTSISADIHKYGYCFKGASVVSTATRPSRRINTFSSMAGPAGCTVRPPPLAQDQRHR